MKTIKSKIATALILAGMACNSIAAEIKIGYSSDPVTLDPHEQLSGMALQYSHMVFDPLVRYTKELGFEYRLAKSAERLNDKVMRFKLRENVKFHSGNTLNVDDVIWTFNRISQSPDYKKIFSPFEKIEKVDDYTFDVITKVPYPLVPQALTFLFPMDSKFYTGKTAAGKDKSELVKHGNSFASTHLSGTGPFVVTAREQGVKMEFARFADYWDKDSKGNVNKITLVPIKEDTTRVAALLSGSVDMIYPVSPNDHQRIKKTKGIDLIDLPGTMIITVQMNQNRNEALKDVRVRQAIIHAINNEGIVKRLMRGFATTAHQFSPKGYAGHNTELSARFDLKKAKALMKEAGYAKGFTLSMIAPNNRYINDARIAQSVATMLSQINIKVDLKTMPKAQYWPEFDKCAADLLLIGWLADTQDSANFSEYLAMTRDASTGQGQYNCTGYANPQFDSMVRASNQETNTEKRAEILRNMEAKLYQDAVFVPLHWQNESWGSKATLKTEDIVNPVVMPYIGDLVVNKL